MEHEEEETSTATKQKKCFLRTQIRTVVRKLNNAKPNALVKLPSSLILYDCIVLHPNLIKLRLKLT